MSVLGHLATALPCRAGGMLQFMGRSEFRSIFERSARDTYLAAYI